MHLVCKDYLKKWFPDILLFGKSTKHLEKHRQYLLKELDVINDRAERGKAPIQDFNKKLTKD